MAQLFKERRSLIVFASVSLSILALGGSLLLFGALRAPRNDLPGLTSAAPAQSGSYVAGTHYEVLSPASPAPANRVVAFFSYACGACLGSDEIISKWADSKASRVDFARSPLASGKSEEDAARIYAAANILGLTSLHQQIFQFYQSGFSNQSPVSLFERYGVTPQMWDSALASEGAQLAVTQYRATAEALGVHESPVLIVSGKYKITVSRVGSAQEALAIADFLLGKESAAISKPTQNR